MSQIKPNSIKELAKYATEQRELERDAPSTGLPDLDKCIGGFTARHLYTLTGQTDSGKTSLAATFADAVRKQGKKVLYIALEPDINILIMLASVRLNKPYSELQEDDIAYDDGFITILLQEHIKNLKHLVEIIKSNGEQYSLIIVDHISYFVTGENTNQEQSNTLKTLAGLAKELATAILLIAHVRKDIKGYITPDDISGSGSFKQDSTDIIIVQRSVENEDAIVPVYKPEAFLTVPKTKRFTQNRVCEVLFQKDRARVLSKYFG